MKRIFFPLLLFVFIPSNESLAQKRTPQLIINGGLQYSGFYNANFNLSPCKGCIRTRGYQKSSYDFSILYQIPMKKNNWSHLLGIGRNRKSMVDLRFKKGDLGIAWQMDYWTLYYGVNFEKQLGKKTQFFGRFLLSPEIPAQKDNHQFINFHTFTAALRTAAGIEYQVSPKLAIQLSPYFYTGLTNMVYPDPVFEPLENMPNFIPLSFGFNIGLVFKKTDN